MDVEAAFVADGEPSELVEPCEAAFDHPAMAAKSLAGLDTPASNPRLDLATVTGAAATAMVIGLVGVQLVRSAPWSAALAGDGWNGVEQAFERHAVVDVGPGQQEGERDAAAVCGEVAFGAEPASIGWVGASRGTPFLAAMDELSTQARLQSIRSASRNRRNNSRCRRSHIPAVCQSRSRRQQVTPEPHPISAGSNSQGMPVRRTNRMPVSAARYGTRGRPPFGFGAASGSKGSIINQSSSGTRSVGILARWEHAYSGSRF